MRILQLISSTGHYGAESVVATLAEKLPCMGIETCVGHIRYRADKQRVFQLEDHLRNCEVIPFEHSHKFEMGIVQRLRKEVKKRNIDAIHCHGYKPDLYGGLVGKIANIPVMSTCHLWTRATAALRRYARLDAMILRNFDKVVAVSEPIFRELQLAGIPAGNLALIPNGISIGRFATAPPIYMNLFGAQAFIFGAACRQVPAKGIDLLLNSIPRVNALAPSTRFLIAGDGPFLNEYRELASRLGVGDKVVFLGRCNSMPEFYASLSTFVLPSRDEGLPIALLEAMASGQMVIATDVGSVGSVVHNCENGLLIPPDNLEALIVAMLSVVSNRDRLSRFGAAAQHEVTTNYSSGRMVRRYAQLYEELRQV